MTTTKLDFKSQLRKRAAESAQENLKSHTVQQLHRDGDPGRIWRCTNGGSSVYGFTVHAPPGWLMISGDMGECMWSRTRDMIDFARQSIGSLNYFSEKASRDSKITEVYQELAQEWLDQAESDWKEMTGEPMDEEELEKLSEIRSAYELYNNPEDLKTAIYESGMYDSCSYIPTCEYYTYHYLWKIEALKWFIAKIDAGEFTTSGFSWFDESDLYLLQNCSGGYVGNSPVFWREGGFGYTPWIDDAKRWTKEEAEAQIRSTTGSHKWKMWPLSIIRQSAKQTVDIQDLRKTKQ